MDQTDLPPNTNPKEKLVAPVNFSLAPSSKPNPIIITVILILGVVSGFAAQRYLPKSNKLGSSANLAKIQSEVPTSGVKVGDIYGNPDVKAFKDSATGVIDKGGLNGEGTHQLLRPGGASQTVYLTSSVIDLDNLVGHQVTVWGETFAGRKAGWLMDVGRAKVEQLNAPTPQ